MGKGLIIKGADFSENAINSSLSMEVFNTSANGKFKVTVNNQSVCSFLNLSSNSAAANWCIEYIDVTSYRGKTLKIGYNGLASTDNKDVVFLNLLLDDVNNKNYNRATFTISNNYVVGYDNFPTADDIEVVVPNDAVIMYVSYVEGYQSDVSEV